MRKDTSDLSRKILVFSEAKDEANKALSIHVKDFQQGVSSKHAAINKLAPLCERFKAGSRIVPVLVLLILNTVYLICRIQNEDKTKSFRRNHSRAFHEPFCFHLVK